MINNILTDIDKLAKKFSTYGTTDEPAIFKAWKDEATRAAIISDLAGHDAVKMLLKEINSEIFEMDMLLLNADSVQLPEYKRDRVIDRKKLYVWFRSFFTEAEASLDRVTAEVARNIQANKVE